MSAPQPDLPGLYSSASSETPPGSWSTAHQTSETPPAEHQPACPQADGEP